jgi:predicted metal-binding membrane protein
MSQPSTGARTASCAETGAPGPTRTAVETLLLRDRLIVGSALVVAILLCWAWIVPMARDMYGSMKGASAWMMTDTWDASHLTLLFAMWAVMMAGMMLPVCRAGSFPIRRRHTRE